MSGAQESVLTSTDHVELDEGSSVAEEVDARLGIKHPGFGGRDFQEEVLQRTVTDLAGKLIFFVLCEVTDFAEFVGNASRSGAHFEEQVVRIDHRAFA